MIGRVHLDDFGSVVWHLAENLAMVGWPASASQARAAAHIFSKIDQKLMSSFPCMQAIFSVRVIKV